MKQLTEQLKEAIAEKVIAINDEPGELPKVAGIGSAATSCSEIVKEYAMNFVKYITLDEWEYSNGRYVRNVFNSNGELILEKISHNEIYALFLKETESNQQEVNNG